MAQELETLEKEIGDLKKDKEKFNKENEDNCRQISDLKERIQDMLDEIARKDEDHNEIVKKLKEEEMEHIKSKTKLEETSR